jgi:hypothetical protein
MANPTRKPVTETENLIPDISHMGGLAVALVVLLDEASDLPEPSSIDVCGILYGHVHDHIDLWFHGEAASKQAIALWAGRFGGVIEAKPQETETGPELWVRTAFPFMDLVKVNVYANVKLPQPEATQDAEQASDPETVPV